MSCKLKFSALILLGSILLSACSLLFPYTSEGQAAEVALQHFQEDFPEAKESAIKLLQTQRVQIPQLGEIVFVLIHLQQNPIGALLDQCIPVYVLQRGPADWDIAGKGIFCFSTDWRNLRLGVNSGFHSIEGPQPLSYVFGLVFDPRIVTVEVTWDDGEKQLAEVVNDSYLVWREAEQSPVQILGLNVQGEPVNALETEEPD